jgi:hypothetical protein
VDTKVSFCSKNRTIRDGLLGLYIFSCNNSAVFNPYWTSGEKGLELIELSSINKVSLV